ncbi:MAG: HEPN domain-containing protein [Planctomycetes bacterium]|nr:HEPN domain-containing protein [Planctomycetota bacterium]
MKDRTEYVRDWFQKARNDLKIARDEMQTPEPATDGVCFHFQQAVEKMLKTWLIWRNIHFQPVHNIEVLLKQCEGDDRTFAELRGAENLTPYSVDVRYGDDFYMPTREETEEADRIAQAVEAFILKKFADAGISPAREKPADQHAQGETTQDPDPKP